MKSDESIVLVDSEAENAYGLVVAKEEHKNPKIIYKWEL